MGGDRRPSAGASVGPAHRAFCGTLTSTSSVCVCARTHRHTRPHTDVPARSHTLVWVPRRAELTCPHAHSDTQSPASHSTPLRPLGPDRRDTLVFLGRSFAHPRNGKGRDSHGQREGVYRRGGAHCEGSLDGISESHRKSSYERGKSRGGRGGRGRSQRSSHHGSERPRRLGTSELRPHCPSFQISRRFSGQEKEEREEGEEDGAPGRRKEGGGCLKPKEQRAWEKPR